MADDKKTPTPDSGNVHDSILKTASDAAHSVGDAGGKAADAVHESVGGVKAAADHHAKDAHAAGHGHAEIKLGRKFDHPPEPPTATQLFWYYENKARTKEYLKDHPDAHVYHNVETNWLEKNAEGKLEPKADGALTAAQILHVGRLKDPLPIIKYAPWENHAFLLLAAAILIGIFWAATSAFRRNPQEAMRRPTRGQAFIEWVVDSLEKFTVGVLGPENGRTYFPFIATMFVFILTCNLMGLVPLLKPPTSSWVVTLSLALCTFAYVQWTAFTKLGPASYLHHLAGSPKDAVGYALAPLFIPLEVISTLSKPISLSLRLYGNILGKDILLGVFLMLGIMLVGAISKDASAWIGIPLTVPFYFLGILLSTIQALVFSVLSAIYILMVLPHDHDHGHDDHGHGHHDGAHGHGHGGEAHAH